MKVIKLDKKTHVFYYEAKQSKGFALIATISVMVLLVMIALAMLSLATIETRNRIVQSDQDIAKQNARLALMQAIAQLQIATGQDQRITAPADFAGTADGDRLNNGAQPGNNAYPSYITSESKGLTAVLPGTRYWLGVWENASSKPEEEIYEKAPSARHIDYLISGMEFDPSINPNSSDYAIGANGEVSDTDKAVVLVGKNSAGAPSNSTLDNYVSAPLVKIAGQGSQSGDIVGRYAWWIGDEGTKTRIDMPVEYTSNTNATYAMLAASRRGWEAVTGFESYFTPGKDAEQLGKVISRRSMELVDPAIGKGAPSSVQANFHALTEASVGIFTDPIHRGLKFDLTSYCERGFPSAMDPDVLNPPLATNTIIPKSIAPDIKGPKWSDIRSFYQLGKSLRDRDAKLTVTARSEGSAGTVTIAPLICDLRVLCGAIVEDGGRTDVYYIRPVGKIAISIANPYGRILKWDQPLEVELIGSSAPGVIATCIWEMTGQPRYLPDTGSVQRPSVFGKALFKIPPGELPAGEARTYTNTGAIRRGFNANPIDVDLESISRADPQNFEHAIVLESPYRVQLTESNRRTQRLDVRESGFSANMDVVMRIPGGSDSGELRHLRMFELDNGYFRGAQRNFNHRTIKNSQLKKPFPLQYYGYRLSAPGADHNEYSLPERDPHTGRPMMGIRSSQQRTYADYNLQGVNFHPPITSYDPPPYVSAKYNSIASLPLTGGNTGPQFVKNLGADPLPWGYATNGGPESTILFSPPSQLISLGQLQHMDLTGDDEYVSVGHQPGNAFGNSYATPFVKRHLAKERRTDVENVSVFSGDNKVTEHPRMYYDMSYLLNATIWDRCFFSTISDDTSSSSGTRTGAYNALNQNIITIGSSSDEAIVKDGRKAASQLAMKGMFNINSTSVTAWKAMLASTQHIKHPSDAAGTGEPMFPRSLEQRGQGTASPSGTDEDSYSGYRKLTPSQLDTLAREIVKGVRLRGPFTSMAQFVNRVLVPLDEDRVAGRSGMLQAAIDESGINISHDGSKTAFLDIDIDVDKVRLHHLGGRFPRADYDGQRPTQLPNRATPPIWGPRSVDLNPRSMATILADREMLTSASLATEQGWRSTGMPTWLTQADILQALGASMTVRSDTFRIRAYGDSIDPSTGRVKARAWCEAIIQRIPQFVDSSQEAETPFAKLNDTNKKYGRKYVIVSFRWLTANEV